MKFQVLNIDGTKKDTIDVSDKLVKLKVKIETNINLECIGGGDSQDTNKLLKILKLKHFDKNLITQLQLATSKYKSQKL